MSSVYDLPAEQAAELRRRRLEQLRADRCEALLNIERWSAIPEDLRDGSEPEGIELAHRIVRVCEAQIDALEQTGSEPKPNRAARRARR